MSEEGDGWRGIYAWRGLSARPLWVGVSVGDMEEGGEGGRGGGKGGEVGEEGKREKGGRERKGGGDVIHVHIHVHVYTHTCTNVTNSQESHSKPPYSHHTSYSKTKELPLTEQQDVWNTI